MPEQNIATFEEFRNKFFSKKDKWFTAAKACGINEAFGITGLHDCRDENRRVINRAI